MTATAERLHLRSLRNWPQSGLTYGCWQGWHDQCRRESCACPCHTAEEQLVLDGFDEACDTLIERARRFRLG